MYFGKIDIIGENEVTLISRSYYNAKEHDLDIFEYDVEGYTFITKTLIDN
jgi:hypothetical protein